MRFAYIMAGALAALSTFAAPAFAAPDLTAITSGRSDYLGGDSYLVGEPILLEFLVSNIGDAPAAGTDSSVRGYMADVVISSDNTAPIRFAIYSATFREDALLIGGRMSRTPTLAPGAMHRFIGPARNLGSPPRPYTYLNFALPSGMAPGAYHVCVVVDPGAVISESNERNNVACQPITIRRLTPMLPRLPSPLPLPTPRPKPN